MDKTPDPMAQIEAALDDACQKAMDYARNTDFGGEDSERLAALYAAKDHALALIRRQGQPQILDDRSTRAIVGGLGNEVHNLGCDHNFNPRIAARLSDISSRLWTVAQQCSPDAQGSKVGERRLAPVEPTPEMIDAGAQRLVSWEDGCVWPDSWGALQIAAARNEAERVWRSMWLAAPPTPTPDEAGVRAKFEEWAVEHSFPTLKNAWGDYCTSSTIWAYEGYRAALLGEGK